MKKIAMITMLAGAVCACSGDKATKAIDPVNFNNEIALEQDFYEHFTGGWQKLNPLKPEYSRYGAFDVVRENNEVRINELFTELAAQTHESGSVAQKIADLYNLGMDSVRLNTEAAQPVMEDLARIREVSTAKTLAALVADMHTTSGAPFFMPFVDADLVNPDENALYLYQAGLGMDNKEYYLEAENERILNAYKTYVTTLFELAGFGADEAAAAMENVLAVEMDIAKGSLSQVELRDIQRNYNPMSVAKLKADYPAFDWNTYFQLMGIEVESVVVGQPSVLAAMNSLVKKMNTEQMRDYLSFHYLNSAANYLSDDWSNANFEFFGRVMSGQEQPRPRWKRALGAPNHVLGEAVGELYVAKYFPESHKAKVLEMVQNLHGVGNMLQNVPLGLRNVSILPGRTAVSFLLHAGYDLLHQLQKQPGRAPPAGGTERKAAHDLVYQSAAAAAPCRAAQNGRQLRPLTQLVLHRKANGMVAMRLIRHHRHIAAVQIAHEIPLLCRIGFLILRHPKAARHDHRHLDAARPRGNKAVITIGAEAVGKANLRQGS